MNEIIPGNTPVKRRRYPKAFKAKNQADCDQPGACETSIRILAIMIRSQQGRAHPLAGKTERVVSMHRKKLLRAGEHQLK